MRFSQNLRATEMFVTGLIFFAYMAAIGDTEKVLTTKNHTAVPVKCGADGTGNCRNVVEVAHEQVVEQSVQSSGKKVDQTEVKSPQTNENKNQYARKETMENAGSLLVGISTEELLSGKRIRDDEFEPNIMDHFADSFHAQNEYNPYSPVVRCDFLPLEFLECEQPPDLQGNLTQFAQQGYGCHTYGGRKWEDVQHSAAWCLVMPGIECYGLRQFLREGFPCVKYSGYSFLSTFIYSLLLGFLGVDRFCLGYTGLGAAKLLTVGGFGVWWFVDIVLLITGDILPADGSNWAPDY